MCTQSSYIPASIVYLRYLWQISGIIYMLEFGKPCKNARSSLLRFDLDFLLQLSLKVTLDKCERNGASTKEKQLNVENKCQK